MHSKSKRKPSVDSSDLSEDGDDGYDDYKENSAFGQLQKGRRLGALKHATKAKLSTQYPKKFKTDSYVPSSSSVVAPSLKRSYPYDKQLERQFAIGQIDATYFQMLTERGTSKFTIQEESEDFCFICKDGGLLIECDWADHGCNSRRCPKVYHEECLGYSVPKDVMWKCPRHRCQLCGALAKFSCRFCVNSYCPTHVPRDIKKMGCASRDIPGSIYVFCGRCEHESQEALETGKLSGKTYALMLRPLWSNP